MMATIPITNRLGEVVAEALVDDGDHERLARWRWSMATGGYAKRSAWDGAEKRYRSVTMHREVVDAAPGEQVDHLNGDGLDNRRRNLRRATAGVNGRNRRTPSRRASSRWPNVVWNRSSDRWQAQCERRGRLVYLGTFVDELDAAQAVLDYLRAERDAP